MEDSDTVICTTNKKLMTFFKGCLTKNCFVDIEVKQIEPFVVYEPAFEVYYILHGDNKVVIVKEGISLKVCFLMHININLKTTELFHTNKFNSKPNNLSFIFLKCYVFQIYITYVIKDLFMTY